MLEYSKKNSNVLLIFINVMEFNHRIQQLTFEGSSFKILYYFTNPSCRYLNLRFYLDLWEIKVPCSIYRF